MTDGDRRENWWTVVAATPVSTLAIPALGEAGAVVLLPFLVLFPVALWLDAGYVRAATDDGPRRWAVAVGAALGVVSLGLLTWVIAPGYLLRRHRLVGVP